VADPERITFAILAGFHRKDLFKNFQVVWNFEFITGIYMAEEIIEIIETAPGYRRKAKATGLMSR